MPSSPVSTQSLPASPPGSAPQPSLLHQLYSGSLPWERLCRFPEQGEADRRRGDQVVASVTALLREHVDPNEIERTGQLPDGLMQLLHEGGYNRLMLPARLGGLGLSPYNALRVITTAAGWSTPVAFSLGITNGFGSGSYLPLIPAGPLHDLISERVAQGIASAGADAEAIGTANQRRTTTAVSTGDGFFEITGEKLYIGNGSVAELMDVSATVTAPDGREEVRLFFVESRTPGFTVAHQHEFMGLRGSTIAALRLDRVRVPASHMMTEDDDGWRMRPGERAATETAPRTAPDGSGPLGQDGGHLPTDLGQLAALGRTLVIAPSSLAIARLCLHWQREFVSRRQVDGRPLGSYQQIQHSLAETAADVFTIETVLDWALLTDPHSDNQPELTAAKNLASVTCWRVVDRTVSLLGAEGYETARSKAGRGAQPLPVERFFRDARALRVAGGVDFMVDKWTAESALTTCWLGQSPALTQIGSETDTPGDTSAWSPRSTEQARRLREQVRTLADTCRRLTADRKPEEVFEDQRTTTVLGRAGGEVLSAALVLGRAATLAARGDRSVTALAEIACAGSLRRLDSLWNELDLATDPARPDYTDVATKLLDAGGLDRFLRDVITDLPAFGREDAAAHA